MACVYFPRNVDEAVHWTDSGFLADSGPEYSAGHKYGARAFLDGYANIPLRRGGDCYVEGWRRGNATRKAFLESISADRRAAILTAATDRKEG